MPEHETRAPRTLYDRETEHPHDESRARRPVADWGGDDLFTRTPRRRTGRHGRRFEPTTAEAATESAQAAEPTLEADAQRTGTRRFARTAEPNAESGVDRTAEPDAERVVDGSAERAVRSRRFAPADLADALEPDRLFAEEEDDAARAPGASGALGELGDPGVDESAPPAPVDDDAPVPRPTVVIGRSGRPEAPHPHAPYLSVSRRRPPRTIAERLGGSPERLVAWAFALGILLILIAVATADAAIRAV